MTKYRSVIEVPNEKTQQVFGVDLSTLRKETISMLQKWQRKSEFRLEAKVYATTESQVESIILASDGDPIVK